eukprot:CAMPEP_0198210266 /NCGR_PEP_ID=MMETSP1445-20131203/19997_1 /TAXON_ID=36898 /ORGANISM="Pyramimonas sp., Strain CCMP2087" /LENGTH=172 /DNA_ID=CAMNT_0043884285 /DNA_START=347 /DNA_END=865 /DNA_ORIENTATION=+
MALMAAQGVKTSAACAAAVQVVDVTEGTGGAAIKQGSLVLLHYVGTEDATGATFDSTRGGLDYRDGGPGIFRPVIVTVGQFAPGVVEGLQQGLVGMTAGGVRSIKVPAELGFGSSSVSAPYAQVSKNADLTYEVEVLRVSNSGPDDLMKFINFCGQGGMSQQEKGCRDISPP